MTEWTILARECFALRASIQIGLLALRNRRSVKIVWDMEAVGNRHWQGLIVFQISGMQVKYSALQ